MPEIIGQRLAGVETPPDGGYGPFAVEVPYNIDSLTVTETAYCAVTQSTDTEVTSASPTTIRPGS